MTQPFGGARSRWSSRCSPRPRGRGRRIVEAFADGRVRVVPLRAIPVPEGRTLQVWTLWDRQVGPRSVGLMPAARQQDYATSGMPRPATSSFTRSRWSRPAVRRPGVRLGRSSMSDVVEPPLGWRSDRVMIKILSIAGLTLTAVVCCWDFTGQRSRALGGDDTLRQEARLRFATLLGSIGDTRYGAADRCCWI